jgi:cell division protein FtsQ
MATLQAATELPADIRLMNAAANALLVLLAIGVLAALALWLARAPWLGIRMIQLEGDLQRNSVSTIRANAAPRLAGNILSIDLERARAAFEAVPWVRQAQLRRVWPDRLAVRLAEHRPAALWQGDDGLERLVNSHGEVFEANLGDVEDEALPVFTGPQGSSAQMLAMYSRLAPLFDGAGLRLQQLQLSGRGSWRAAFYGGASVEIGRGSDAQIERRVADFSATLAQMTSRYQRAFEYADLRHEQGYALSLQGITTGTAPAPAARK